MDIKDLREKIDSINDQMLELFLERMQISSEVAKYKKQNNKPIFDPERERDILYDIGQKSGEEMENYSRILFSELFNLSRAYQSNSIVTDHPLRNMVEDSIKNTEKVFPQKAIVACQGIEGSYSQQACDKLFPKGNILYFRNFEAVFQAVEKGLCKYGILPIENSSYGSVNEVYDLIQKHHFYIAKSIKFHVSHSLLAKKGAKLSDIKHIYSHEQALGQCSEFLKENFDIKIHVCENTAVAAKMASESDSNDVAAISSSNCAKLYDLSVIENEVQNDGNNYTRFICISRDMEIYSGASKISIVMSLKHKPGSLRDMLSRFASLGLNLTKLESRPISGKDFEFLFYFDLEASVLSNGVMDLLCNLANTSDVFTFLGNYSEV